MDNGPGRNWGTGVADARLSELIADASGTAPAGAASQIDDGGSYSEGTAFSPAALSGGSPGRVISLVSGGVGYGGEALGKPKHLDGGAISHMLHIDHPGNSNSAGAGGVASSAPASATASPPHECAVTSHQTPDAAAVELPCGNNLLENSTLTSTEHRGDSAKAEGASSTADGGGGSGAQAAGDPHTNSIPETSGVRDGDGINASQASRSNGSSGSGDLWAGGGGGHGMKSSCRATASPSAFFVAAGGGAGGVAGTGGGGSGSGGSQFLSGGSSNSMLEHVSREVIRKLRLAVSAGSPEDRHVVCEELFADITCALDAAAQAALLGPTVAVAVAVAEATGAETAAAAAAMAPQPPPTAVAPSEGGVGGGGGGGGSGEGGDAGATMWATVAGASGRRGRVRGRLYYEVLAVYYASRAAADSAQALLHLCQLLWDAPWVAPIYALLLHRFLLLPREAFTAAISHTGTTDAAGAATAAPAAASGVGGGHAGRPASYGMSYSDPRVKHLNVLAYGARQLLLGDVHSGLSRFQPLWAFLAFEVADLGAQPGITDGGGCGAAAADGLAAPTAALQLPPVTSIDAVPVTARPWLLSVAAAFLPYYCLDEHVSELARRFPPPMPPERAGIVAVRGGGGRGARGAGTSSGGAAAEALAGLDFLVVEVTDVLGKINSEAGLLKYLRALRALARRPPPPTPTPPPPPLLSPTPPGPGPMPQEAETAAPPPPQAGMPAQATALPPVHSCEEAAAATAGLAATQFGSAADGPLRKAVPAAARPGVSPPQLPPLAGLPTITKLRLQSELYSLTSGGGPRYAPPEVRRAAFAALDALFPGGRSLRWFVRWASRTLHLEWLEGDGAGGGSDDPWVGRGWLGWIYWPIHWCTALYGKLLLATFQLIYGIIVWRPSRRDAAALGVASSVINTSGCGGSGGAAADALRPVAPSVITAATTGDLGGSSSSGSGAGGSSSSVVATRGVAAAAAAVAAAVGVVGEPLGGGRIRTKAGPWWQPRSRTQG